MSRLKNSRTRLNSTFFEYLLYRFLRTIPIKLLRENNIPYSPNVAPKLTDWTRNLWPGGIDIRFRYCTRRTLYPRHVRFVYSVTVCSFSYLRATVSFFKNRRKIPRTYRTPNSEPFLQRRGNYGKRGAYSSKTSIAIKLLNKSRETRFKLIWPRTQTLGDSSRTPITTKPE